MSNENAAVGDVRRKGGLGQRIAYACGNLGQAAFYNAMSTYFVTYVTSCLFVSYSKALAAQMIAVITGLIVVIRIAEIFIDPLLGNLVDNTTTKWGRFRPWQFIGGLVSSVLIMPIFSWSALVFGSTATWITGSGKVMESRVIGSSMAHRVSPVVTFFRPTKV